MPNRNRQAQNDARWNREYRLQLETAVEMLKAKENSYVRAIEHGDKNNIAGLTADLNHLRKMKEIKLLQVREVVGIEAQRMNVQFFTEKLRDNQLTEQEKKEFSQELHMANEELKKHKKLLEGFETAETAAEGAYALKKVIEAGVLPKEELEDKKKEMYRLNALEFDALDQERRQTELEEQKSMKERAEKSAEKITPETVKTYGRRTAEDKLLFNVAVTEMRKHLFPGKKEKSLQEMNDLAREINAGNPPAEKNNTLDELSEILDTVIVYDNLHVTAMDTVKKGPTRQKAEEALLKHAYNRLNKLSDKLENMGMNAPEEQVKAVSNLLNYFEGEVNGRLGMVEDQRMEADAHHVRYTGKYMKVDVDERQIFNAYVKEKSKVDADPNRSKDMLNKYDTMIETDRSEQMLFPHPPCAEDLVQNQVGDCFMMATLAQTAQTHPDLLKEMVRDNKDGTATVRFYYREKGKCVPFYVTVDKVDQYGTAEGSTWAQVVERAFAASGMPQHAGKLRTSLYIVTPDRVMDRMRPVPENINEIYEKIRTNQIPGDPEKYPWLYDAQDNLTPWKPSYDDVQGLATGMVHTMLFGDRVVRNIHEHPERSDYMREADKPAVRLNARYSKGELEVYQRLQKAGKEQDIVTAQTRNQTPGSADTIHGILKAHEYSVVKVVETDKIGDVTLPCKRKFVVVRDPNAQYGRQYTYDAQNNRLVSSRKEDAKGVSMVELSDFCREFSSTVTAKVRPSSAVRAEREAAEERKTVEAYKESIREIRRYLDKNVKSWWDSNAYDQLKLSLHDATKFTNSYVDLRKKLNDLESKMNDYVDHVNKDEKHDRKYRAEKLHACEAISNLVKASKKGFMRPNDYMDRMMASKIMDQTAAAEAENNPLMQKAQTAVLENRTAAGTKILETGILHEVFSDRRDIVSQSVLLKNKTIPLTDAESKKICSAMTETKQDRPLNKVTTLNDPQKIKNMQDELERRNAQRNAQANNVPVHN